MKVNDYFYFIYQFFLSLCFPFLLCRIENKDEFGKLFLKNSIKTGGHVMTVSNLGRLVEDFHKLGNI